MYEWQVQTSTQSAPISAGKALVLNCFFYVIRQEEEIFLDELWFKKLVFSLQDGDCNQLQLNVLVCQGSWTTTTASTYVLSSPRHKVKSAVLS